MSKKDYIKFAEMFKEQREQLDHAIATDKTQTALDLTCAKALQWKETVKATAQIFQRDNPSFNRDRFLTACGMIV